MRVWVFALPMCAGPVMAQDVAGSNDHAGRAQNRRVELVKK